MRLDLVLKKSGLIKRRTIAKEFSENGKVSINGHIAKPSSDVKKDDILILNFGSKKMVVRIDFVMKGKSEIPVCYVIEEG